TRFLAAAGRDALTVAEPVRPIGRLLDVRTAFAPLPGQTRRPDVGRHRVDVEMVVGRDQYLLSGKGHGCFSLPWWRLASCGRGYEPRRKRMGKSFRPRMMKVWM